MFIKKYFKLQKEYEKKYGENTIVIIEKGKFFEIYGYPKEDKYIGKAKYASELLGMNLGPSGKDISEITKEVPHIVGFPNYVLEKHISKLSDKYTVIICNQIKEDNKVIEHKVTQILSPGTSIDEIKPTNYICSVAETFSSIIKNTKVKYTTVIFVDVSTGKNFIYDFINDTNDEKLNRLIISYNPVEIILESHKDFEGIKALIHIRKIDPIYEKLTYQMEFLSRVFSDGFLKTLDMKVKQNQDNSINKMSEKKQNNIEKNHKESTNTNILETLKLDRHSHVVPYYINLLQFIYEHDNQIINNINLYHILKR